MTRKKRRSKRFGNRGVYATRRTRPLVLQRRSRRHYALDSNASGSLSMSLSSPASYGVYVLLAVLFLYTVPFKNISGIFSVYDKSRIVEMTVADNFTIKRASEIIPVKEFDLEPKENVIPTRKFHIPEKVIPSKKFDLAKKKTPVLPPEDTLQNDSLEQESIIVEDNTVEANTVEDSTIEVADVSQEGMIAPPAKEENHMSGFSNIMLMSTAHAATTVGKKHAIDEKWVKQEIEAAAGDTTEKAKIAVAKPVKKTNEKIEILAVDVKFSDTGIDVEKENLDELFANDKELSWLEREAEAEKMVSVLGKEDKKLFAGKKENLAVSKKTPEATKIKPVSSVEKESSRKAEKPANDIEKEISIIASIYGEWEDMEAEEWERREAESSALSRAQHANRPTGMPEVSIDRKSIDDNWIAEEINESRKSDEIQLASLGAIPAIASKEPPWRHYAVAMPENKEDFPMIAVVIDDLGVDKKRTGKILELPGPLTTSFLSYARNLKAQTKRARNAGHELLMHIPMEPRGRGYDPGPVSLQTSMSEDEILNTFDKLLGSFDGYVGINNHMGSRFTGSRKSMNVVMKELKKRGLLFLDSRTTSKSVGPSLARREEVPHAMRHIFLDNFPGVKTVKRQLRKLEHVAERHGFAVGIGHPRNGTIEALRQWLPTLKERGFVLVPLTSIVNYKMLSHSRH